MDKILIKKLIDEQRSLDIKASRLMKRRNRIQHHAKFFMKDKDKWPDPRSATEKGLLIAVFDKNQFARETVNSMLVTVGLIHIKEETGEHGLSFNIDFAKEAIRELREIITAHETTYKEGSYKIHEWIRLMPDSETVIEL